MGVALTLSIARRVDWGDHSALDRKREKRGEKKTKTAIHCIVLQKNETRFLVKEGGGERREREKKKRGLPDKVSSQRIRERKKEGKEKRRRCPRVSRIGKPDIQSV